MHVGTRLVEVHVDLLSQLVELTSYCVCLSEGCLFLHIIRFVLWYLLTI